MGDPKEYYEVDFNDLVVAKLPIVEVKPGIKIAVFDCYADFMIASAAAEGLCEKLQKKYNNYIPADAVMTTETKGIPFAWEIAKNFGLDLILCRKSQKSYIKEVYTASTSTFTTEGDSTIYADASIDLKGKRVILVDDVVSTGASFKAMESIVEQYGATVTAKAAIFAEGEAANMPDLEYLHVLPLF